MSFIRELSFTWKCNWPAPDTHKAYTCVIFTLCWKLRRQLSVINARSQHHYMFLLFSQTATYHHSKVSVRNYNQQLRTPRSLVFQEFRSLCLAIVLTAVQNKTCTSVRTINSSSAAFSENNREPRHFSFPLECAYFISRLNFTFRDFFNESETTRKWAVIAVCTGVLWNCAVLYCEVHPLLYSPSFYLWSSSLLAAADRASLLSCQNIFCGGGHADLTVQ